MSLVLQNFILFQIGWFACVLGGASEYSLIGVPTVLAIIFIHLVRASNATREINLILITTLIGAVWDSVLTFSGVFVFSSGVFLDGVAPHWLIAMWALFATTLNVSLKWFKGKWLLSVLFGAVGGALAYYAGHRIGAVEFSNTSYAMALVATGWAIIFPLLMLIAAHYNGYRGLMQHGNREAYQNE